METRNLTKNQEPYQEDKALIIGSTKKLLANQDLAG